MKQKTTKEVQYMDHLLLKEAQGLTPLGLRANMTWHEDPRRFMIVLSRYKFVAKMLSGKKRVLEVGCGDAFGSRLLLQEVGSLCAIDFDPVFVEDVKNRMDKNWAFDCRVHDILSGPVEKEAFDAAYALDIIEHIPKTEEQRFMTNITRSLKNDGVLILGTPSVQSQIYASKWSREGHINCKDHKELKELVLGYFENVFLFSMNDEVVHTGFSPMAHYLFVIACGKKPERNF
ncbi:MAG: class I SAM-dependent methyltransferase [Elusimicrobia bacterium]|nr:class I SAM-dependent methyltransferase [Elusimicrobiota bacterium]